MFWIGLIVGYLAGFFGAVVFLAAARGWNDPQARETGLRPTPAAALRPEPRLGPRMQPRPA
jgi:hypothetical protein